MFPFTFQSRSDVGLSGWFLFSFQSSSDLETSRGRIPQTRCDSCSQPVHLIQRRLSGGKVYHRSCFRSEQLVFTASAWRCAKCQRILDFYLKVFFFLFLCLSGVKFAIPVIYLTVLATSKMLKCLQLLISPNVGFSWGFQVCTLWMARPSPACLATLRQQCYKGKQHKLMKKTGRRRGRNKRTKKNEAILFQHPDKAWTRLQAQLPFPGSELLAPLLQVNSLVVVVRLFLNTVVSEARFSPLPFFVQKLQNIKVNFHLFLLICK